MGNQSVHYLAQQFEPGVSVVGGEHLEHQRNNLRMGRIIKYRFFFQLIRMGSFPTSSTYSSGDSFLPILSTAPRTEAAEAPPSNSYEDQIDVAKIRNGL